MKHASMDGDLLCADSLVRLVASRNDPAVLVRMPGDLRDRLASVARNNGRSRNSEILFLLSHSLGDLSQGAAE